MATIEKVKAVQDSDGHWYVIPDFEFTAFYEMLEDGEVDDWNSFNERFSQYMTGGDLNLVQLYAEI
jgi:hypothetical protein